MLLADESSAHECLLADPVAISNLFYHDRHCFTKSTRLFAKLFQPSHRQLLSESSLFPAYLLLIGKGWPRETSRLIAPPRCGS